MILTRAPLRVPIGGGGTDFPSFYKVHGGYILGFAIQKYVYVVIHKTSDKQYHLKYSKTEVSDNLYSLDNRVAAEALKFFDVPPGLEISTFSDVPESSGLGGSSSFCVALVLALRTLQNKKIIPDLLFTDSYDIERRKANQPGGFQDQFFASYGNAQEINFTDIFFSPSNVNSVIEGLLPHLRLVYVGNSSKRLDIAKIQDLKTKQGDQDMVNNLLAVKQIGKEIMGALVEGNYDEVGGHFRNHWESKKKRDPNITNETIDYMYSEGLKSGAIGGKLIGMGGGGYILFCGDKLNGRFPSVELKLDTEGAKVLYKE